ncbi:hypothetical protein RB195_014636 [Necator americanus]|uniref:Phospholipid scramblase n=1 Tax=Necator americanus TaxID=51031 RepID=A0ABR1E295_NECAM
MVRRQADMAEIRVDIVDDFLHPPSQCNGCFLRVPESSHHRLPTGEVPMGIADVLPRLCSISQHFCSSLFKVFLYRLSAKPCELGREFLVPCGSCCSTLAYQLKSFRRQASLGGFETQPSSRSHEGVQRAAHILRRCCPLQNLPKSRLA